MIIYSPLDGDALTTSIPSNPRHCFLMTRLGDPVPHAIEEIRLAVSELCGNANYTVIDARSRVTGRDFLMKIWRLIASAPLSIGICHEEIPTSTQANIYYELGVAQALGKETLLIKSPNVAVPSDFIRTEYVEFNPILAIDYLKRAFLISGEERLREKAQSLLDEAGLDDRARNSVELLAAAF